METKFEGFIREIISTICLDLNLSKESQNKKRISGYEKNTVVIKVNINKC